MFSYAPLWETMKKKNVSTYALIHKHDISTSLINRLRHNKGVTVQTIVNLCKILDCKVEDIVEYVPEK